jgi:exodeoxyribonuclease VII small subunit
VAAAKDSAGSARAGGNGTAGNSAGGSGTGGKAGHEARDAGTKTPRPAYEQARDELTELVKRLEAGGLTLEQSLQLWERGEELAAICEEWLEGARARLATSLARQDAAGPEPGAPV